MRDLVAALVLIGGAACAAPPIDPSPEPGGVFHIEKFRCAEIEGRASLEAAGSGHGVPRDLRPVDLGGEIEVGAGLRVRTGPDSSLVLRCGGCTLEIAGESEVVIPAPAGVTPSGATTTALPATIDVEQGTVTGEVESL